MKEYKMMKEMAQNRSVWHMKTKAGPLLHGKTIRKPNTFINNVTYRQPATIIA